MSTIRVPPIGPTRDLAAGVLAVDRVVGRLQDRNEERVCSLTAGPRVVVATVLRDAGRGHLPCMFPDRVAAAAPGVTISK
jgi:hypothetical protein